MSVQSSSDYFYINTFTSLSWPCLIWTSNIVTLWQEIKKSTRCTNLPPTLHWLLFMFTILNHDVMTMKICNIWYFAHFSWYTSKADPSDPPYVTWPTLPLPRCNSYEPLPDSWFSFSERKQQGKKEKVEAKWAGRADCLLISNNSLLNFIRRSARPPDPSSPKSELLPVLDSFQWNFSKFVELTLFQDDSNSTL